MRKLSILLLTALAACSSAPAPSAAPPPPAPAPQGLAAGVYELKLADADLPGLMDPGTRNAIAGSWEMSVEPGIARVRLNGHEVVDLPFTVQGNEVAFGEDSGQYACHSPSRYAFESTATALRFTKVEDGCDGRAVLLTVRPWTKRP